MELGDKKERGRSSRTEQDWSELMKDATPEDVARELLSPLRNPKAQPAQENPKRRRVM